MKMKLSTLLNAYLLTSLLSCLPLFSEAYLKDIDALNEQLLGYEHLFDLEMFSNISEPQNTLKGLRSSSGYCTIENYNNIACTKQVAKSNGAVFNASSLTLRNNTGDIKFICNSTNAKGGVIWTSGSCNISENSSRQYFINNHAINIESAQSNSTNFGGAICCKTFELTKNCGPICFADNIAQMNGGAISSDELLKISENSSPILFLNNRAFFRNARMTSRGGALYCQNCEISANSAPLYFISNSSPIGGACYVTRTHTIKNNTGAIVFSNNFSSCNDTKGSNSSGGAVTCTDLNIEDNPGPVYFNNNIAYRNGGAIYCTRVTIKNSGPVQFANNQSKWGGAILINHNGSCDISADYGDIVFVNNSGIGDFDLFKNSLHCTRSVTLKVGAKKNYAVKFYDPIECLHYSPSVVFNEQEDQQGTVLFSSMFLPFSSSRHVRDYTTYIRNPIEIKHGILAVEDGACIAINKITQDNSILRLGNGAGIQTNEFFTTRLVNNLIISSPEEGSEAEPGSAPTAPKSLEEPAPRSINADLQITRLALNLPSLLQKGAKAPKIWIYPSATTSNGITTYSEDDTSSATLSGPLLLLDSENEDPYDSLDLSIGITRIPLLYLCDNATPKITTTALDIEAINEKQHYGYQGVWSPYWEEYKTTANGKTPETTNTNHRYLYTNWTPTGYIPNPKYMTPLIANALWGTLYTTLSGLRTLPSSMTAPTYFELGGQGLVTAIHQANRLGVPGFRMESAGYSAGTTVTTTNNHRVSVSFAQQSVHIKEKESKNKLSSRNYFGGTLIQMPWLDESIITSASLAYNYGSHTAKHFYVKDDKESEGDFYTHSFAGSVNCIFNLTPITKDFSITPFLEVLAFRATLSSFVEHGDFPRAFTVKRPLTNISLPTGLMIQWTRNAQLPTIWQVQLTYQPVVLKRHPKVLTTLLASKGTWSSLGTPISRHAFAYKIGNESRIFPYLKIFLNYQGDISSSTFSNYLKAGSSLIF
ncbi:autotransporter beta-domain-containing protein [Chlamydia abortus]|uniref:polymorphic outer membrane protein middle domain-containing protein n=1 Tax=Chlamydia abortus TaxID=83555 RepID=UPI000A27D0CB|nr:polymorphic outer membrane protein middle domain-containing protein [Chlamydia abortus]ASD30447.1 Pmp family polymorphic membrane protein autotransporter adhesin [Chlamydia abortus]SGA03506.1 autotransporter beta-domain-containing protein [Chlamydia abortus]SGA03717.1 autotransporter beta-domain-containing protein [Chlamydia abortus]SHD81027.1 autotransporter beta-domain-containing protein [Chlamydia abortus]